MKRIDANGMSLIEAEHGRLIRCGECRRLHDHVWNVYGRTLCIGCVVVWRERIEGGRP